MTFFPFLPSPRPLPVCGERESVPAAQRSARLLARAERASRSPRARGEDGVRGLRDRSIQRWA